MARRHRSIPSRDGISRESGTVIKDWGGRLPVALIYPNTYYLAMSNLGIHAIYRLLNDYDDVVGERVFWEKTNAANKLPPLSLESRRPLADFAALAFSISYELDYFNVMAVIRSSGIPLYAADRDERHPQLIAGGPCITANPLPLSPFFDCLCIGEAEPILPALLPVLREGISGKLDRMNVSAPTAAIADAYDSYADRLSDFLERFRLIEWQVGAVFAINGQVLGLECFGCSDTFEKFFNKLIKSYALDALDWMDASKEDSVPPEKARRFIQSAANSKGESHPSTGLGQTVTLESRIVSGAALVEGERVIHLSAFKKTTGDGSNRLQYQRFSQRRRYR